MRIKKIQRENLDYIKPWSLGCTFCGICIDGNTAKEVIEKANKEGWKYDKKHNRKLCPRCYEEWKKDTWD